MSNFIFSLGKLNKNLIAPLCYLLVYILVDVYYFYHEDNIATFYLESFGMSTAEILIFFVSVIIKHTFKNKSNKNPQNQNYIKDFFFLFLIVAFHVIDDLLPYLDLEINKEDEEKTDTSRVLYINNALVILIITLATFFILKYKYYIHHIISIIIIIILCLIIDLVLENYTRSNTFSLVGSIGVIISDGLLYTYLKYLMENKYYFFLDVLYVYGMLYFFCYLISFAIVIITHRLNGSNKILYIFYNYYQEYGAWQITSRFLFGLFVTGFIVDILEFVILDRLTPNYIIIGYEIGKILSHIIETENDKRWVVLVLSVFQIISLLLYLEIIEFNFCKLNRNTKKNIERRLFLQSNEENNINEENEITIKDYDISEAFNQQEIEMDAILGKDDEEN